MMFEVAPNFLQSWPIRQALHVALDSVWQQLGQWTSTHSGFVRRIVHGHKRRGDAFSLQQLVARTTCFRPLWTHAFPCLRYACLTRLQVFGLLLFVFCFECLLFMFRFECTGQSSNKGPNTSTSCHLCRRSKAVAIVFITCSFCESRTCAACVTRCSQCGAHVCNVGSRTE